jgi:hypothetical protein
METLIENYKNFDIKFDTKYERFNATSEYHDFTLFEETFSGIKLSIDRHVDKNPRFEEFYANLNDSYYGYSKVKIVGIVQGRKFLYVDENGKTRRMLIDESDDYFVYNSQNDDYMEQITEIREQIEHLESRIKELDDKMIKMSLSQYADELKSKS